MYLRRRVSEDIEVPKFVPTSIVGIDLGIKTLVITSDFGKYHNDKIIQIYEKRIKRYQRRLSKKKEC